jgi:hypothetical protein
MSKGFTPLLLLGYRCPQCGGPGSQLRHYVETTRYYGSPQHFIDCPGCSFQVVGLDAQAVMQRLQETQSTRPARMVPVPFGTEPLGIEPPFTMEMGDLVSTETVTPAPDKFAHYIKLCPACDGILRSTEELVGPSGDNRPYRRRYRLTCTGKTCSLEAVGETPQQAYGRLRYLVDKQKLLISGAERRETSTKRLRVKLSALSLLTVVPLPADWVLDPDEEES